MKKLLLVLALLVCFSTPVEAKIIYGARCATVITNTADLSSFWKFGEECTHVVDNGYKLVSMTASNSLFVGIFVK